MQFSKHLQQLLALLADGHFHSGVELARSLGLSRSAVWGLVHEMETLGLAVNAISGKGYRLEKPLELLDAAAIRAVLSTSARALLANLEIHHVLDSTNDWLAGQAAEGAVSGSVCLAECQTAGKGRMGRVWQAPFGGNICLSLLWRFEDQAAIAGLSLSVGAAIIRALHRAGVEGAGLKWPNDILWQGRKLGGILMQVSGEVNGQHAVVIGLGLNGHIPPASAEAIDQPWTDLSLISGEAFLSRNRLIASVLDELLPMLADYGSVGLAAHLDEWRKYHCFNGAAVVLQQGERLIRGRVAGVNEEGLLLLDCEEGGRRAFASGDVRLRLDA